MQHPFGALSHQIAKVQRTAAYSTAPAGDGETRVVSAKCSTILNGHLLRPIGTRDQSSLLLFNKIYCGAVSIEDNYVYEPCSQFETSHHILLNIVD